MAEDIKQNSQKNENSHKKQKIRQKLLGCLGYFVLIAAILYLFAPESCWQFDVAPVENRNAPASFVLESTLKSDVELLLAEVEIKY